MEGFEGHWQIHPKVMALRDEWEEMNPRNGLGIPIKKPRCQWRGRRLKQSLIDSFFSRAGAGLGFKMSGDKEAHAFTAAQFGMLRDFFRTDTIRNEFRGVMLQHFSSSSGPDGKWADLQTETWRRKEWPQMLVESGKLYRSLTNRTALGAVNRIEGSGSKERFVIGTRVTSTRSTTTSERATCRPDFLCRATTSAI